MRSSLDMFKNIVEYYGNVYMMYKDEQVLIKSINLDLYEKNGDLLVIHQQIEHEGEFVKINEFSESIPFIRNGVYLFDHLIIESSDVVYRVLPLRTKNKMKVLDMVNIPINGHGNHFAESPETDVRFLYKSLRTSLRTYKDHDESIFRKELFGDIDLDESQYNGSILTKKDYDSTLNVIRQIHWSVGDC